MKSEIWVLRTEFLSYRAWTSRCPELRKPGTVYMGTCIHIRGNVGYLPGMQVNHRHFRSRIVQMSPSSLNSPHSITNIITIGIEEHDLSGKTYLQFAIPLP